MWHKMSEQKSLVEFKRFAERKLTIHDMKGKVEIRTTEMPIPDDKEMLVWKFQLNELEAYVTLRVVYDNSITTKIEVPYINSHMGAAEVGQRMNLMVAAHRILELFESWK